MEADFEKHEVFNDLETYIQFYEHLSFGIMGWVTPGLDKIFNLDSYIFSSMKGTLESIRDILLKGHINDSYALLRKYHDSIIINIYEIIFLKDHFDIENFIVKKIDLWVKGKEKLPEFKDMMKLIGSQKELESINKLVNVDYRYKEIRSRCNDNMHYNMFYYILLNNGDIAVSRKKSLDSLENDLRDIFILHFAYLFVLNEHYMMSSDYIDNLECGIEPKEGTQYYVAPFIQEIFDKVIKKYRMDIALEIKNKVCMKLE